MPPRSPCEESVDHLYVALPPEQHVRMLELLESTSREMVDVKVVPDLLQVIALRARLEDLDGIPVININEPPLQGFNSIVKRAIDVAISTAALLVLAIPLGIIALLVKMTSKGSVLFHQERMGLDGKSFTIVKFRSMYDDAERHTGPVWAVADDPRVTPLGRFLRRSNLDELPQLWNVLRGDMSIVGPRPERPHFVEQFKHKIPQYMLRHKVKAGLTGWAQVNGWRGNTRARKADRVRPVLHRELVGAPRSEDHVAHAPEGLLPQARLLTVASRESSASRARQPSMPNPNTS